MEQTATQTGEKQINKDDFIKIYVMMDLVIVGLCVCVPLYIYIYICIFRDIDIHIYCSRKLPGEVA